MMGELVLLWLVAAIIVIAALALANSLLDHW